jgi:UDP-N-acetylmuramyl pentapeptide synthase
VSRLFVVGGAPARALGEAAVEAGLPAASVTWFDRSDEAASAVVADVAPGDAVIVKGSRGIRTDVIVDRLLAERG